MIDPDLKKIVKNTQKDGKLNILFLLPSAGWLHGNVHFVKIQQAVYL